MPELGSYGSVRGAAGNSRPYREHGVMFDLSPQKRCKAARIKPRSPISI
jgi:hypothetical protein